MATVSLKAMSKAMSFEECVGVIACPCCNFGPVKRKWRGRKPDVVYNNQSLLSYRREVRIWTSLPSTMTGRQEDGRTARHHCGGGRTRRWCGGLNGIKGGAILRSDVALAATEVIAAACAKAFELERLLTMDRPRTWVCNEPTMMMAKTMSKVRFE